MAVFEYRGLLAASGKQVTGVRDADNAKVLRAVLKREGILLTSAQEEVREGKSVAKGSKGFDPLAVFRRVTVDDIAMMTRQLATLVNAGIPLVECVSALTEQVDKAELKRVLTQVRDRLNEGSSLAKALESHTKVFPNLYVSMVAAGEASGTLEVVLERLADFMESQARLKGKVGGALAYPALMLVIGTTLIGVMMIFVVPKVTDIYAKLDRALPWYTSLLINVSKAVGSVQMLAAVLTIVSMLVGRQVFATRKAAGAMSLPGKIALLVVLGVHLLAIVSIDSWLAYAVGVLIGLVVGFVAARFVGFLATATGRLWRDTLFLKLPIFGPLVRMLAVARFAKTLATLLKSGVPLLKAMEIVRNVLDNARLEKVVEDAAGSIREGESISGPLKRSGDFPPIVTHMIAVGEKSGELEKMLENVARAYDTQVETRVTALTSLLEPLMIVIMGGSVGFIAFSILMPLIQMNEGF
ncbi:MAG: type II secretion system F family protein [Polyangiaceae bacterium]